MSNNKIRVVFVCLGNICRSPAAEGNFRHIVTQKNLDRLFEIDSAGTGAYHVGEPANANARRAAERRGVVLDGRARQFKARDFERFDYILAMDQQNYRDILSLAQSPAHREKVYLFRQFDPDVADSAVPDVPDPYFGGQSGFETVQDIMSRTSGVLLDHILKENGVSSAADA